MKFLKIFKNPKEGREGGTKKQKSEEKLENNKITDPNPTNLILPDQIFPIKR